MGPHPAAVARTIEEARRGRTPAEWAAIREPDTARRRFAEVMARGGPDLEEVVRRGFRSSYAAFTRRDWELNTLYQDADVVFGAGDIFGNLPGGEPEYHGIEGYLRAQEQLLEVWGDLRLELAGIAACDETSVTTILRFVGSAGRSGLELETIGLSHHRFRDGLVVDQTYWFDRAAGLKALGLDLPRPA
jgi:hypothetical protein